MWFEDLFGFKEESPAQVRSNFELEGPILNSKANGRSFQWGELELITLAQLREKSPLSKWSNSLISLKQIVGDIQEIHQRPSNKGALFQAASQFNLLEMVGPHVLPEAGIGRYEYDLTQGPACAIACGAGTLYRNYFVPINGQIGQTESVQVDGLSKLAQYFNNEEQQLWKMRNGYALVSEPGLKYISNQLLKLSISEYDTLRGLLQVGIQWDTEVTVNNNGQLVSQIYCSALPVAYSQVKDKYWEGFARLILEATYEATLHTALINYEKTSNPNVFLTLVGGGAFGNKRSWILEALLYAIQKFQSTPLKLSLVSYGALNQDLEHWIERLKFSAK